MGKRVRSRKSSRKGRKARTLVRAPRARLSRPKTVHGSGNAFGGPLAPRMVTTMKYCDTFTVAITSGVPQEYVFRTNSIYDPDRTSAGHQPMGRDEFLGKFYNRYRVLKSKFIVSSNPSGYSGCTILWASGNSSVPPTLTQSAALEQPGAVFKQWGNYTKNTVSKTVRNWILNGQSYKEYAGDDSTQATYGTDPAELQYLNISFNSATSHTITVYVRAVYYVELFDPIPIGQS